MEGSLERSDESTGGVPRSGVISMGVLDGVDASALQRLARSDFQVLALEMACGVKTILTEDEAASANVVCGCRRFNLKDTRWGESMDPEVVG